MVFLEYFLNSIEPDLQVDIYLIYKYGNNVKYLMVLAGSIIF